MNIVKLNWSKLGGFMSKPAGEFFDFFTDGKQDILFIPKNAKTEYDCLYRKKYGGKVKLLYYHNNDVNLNEDFKMVEDVNGIMLIYNGEITPEIKVKLKKIEEKKKVRLEKLVEEYKGLIV